MATSLKNSILEYLVKNGAGKEQVIRTRISQVRRKNPALTINAAAHLYAQGKNLSVAGKLDNDDRTSLSQAGSTPVFQRIIRKQAPKASKPQVLVTYPAKDPFQKRHLEEINNAYNAKCYTSALILCRKVVENLIIDILRKQFPEKKKKNRDLYYDTAQGRFRDFSQILKNLYQNRKAFAASAQKPIERLHSKAKVFSKDANDYAHSWFYIIDSKTELDEINVQAILALIQTIEAYQ